MIREFKFKFLSFPIRSLFCFSSDKGNLNLFGLEGTFAESMKSNKNLVADKTALIQHLLAARSHYLITRPRRMGKTFNLSMLKCFFDQDERDALTIFKDTYIGSKKQILEEHMNKYPVLSLSLKNINAHNYQDFRQAFAEELAMSSKRFIKEGYGIPKTKNEANKKKLILQKINSMMIENSLADLISNLSMNFQKKIILLIDEYENPLMAAYEKQYYDDAVRFYQSWLTAALKDNPAIYLAVISGVLKIGQESIFSKLNNLVHIPYYSKSFQTCYGFTEAEILNFLRYFKMNEKQELEIIREWYDGYKFGEEHIFNQFSVKNYLNGRIENSVFTPQAFWVHTGSTKIIEDIVLNFKNQAEINEFFHDMKDLLLGKSVKFNLSQQLTFRKILMKSITLNELWTLYFHTGYLTIDQATAAATSYKIPNLEIQQAMHDHMNTILSLSSSNVSNIVKALLNNNLKQSIQNMEIYLDSFNARSIANFFWRGNEGSYHLLFCLVFSNLKGISLTTEIFSGYGYYDLAVVPNEQSDYKKEGFIFEIGAEWCTDVKFQENPKNQREIAQKIANEKQKQILDKNYVSALAKKNPHIKVWHIIGIGCIRTVIAYAHSIAKIEDERK